MKLSEAIEIGKGIKHVFLSFLPPKEQEALSFLIASGEFIMENRGLGAGNVPWLLPGETPE